MVLECTAGKPPGIPEGLRSSASPRRVRKVSPEGHFDDPVATAAMPVAQERVSTWRCVFQQEEEAASPGMERRALKGLRRGQELEGFRPQGVLGEHHPVNPMIHGDELHSISRLGQDPPRQHMLFGPPAPQHHLVHPGAPPQPQKAGRLRLPVHRSLLARVTACQGKEKEKR